MEESSMPPDDSRADSPMRWLENAHADLSLAHVALPFYEHLCFHAQQAAEKSLKAVLLALDMDIPFTHNIQALLDRLERRVTVAEEVRRAVDLNPYAVATRYPGEIEPVTEDEYLEALRLADVVVGWAETLIRERSSGLT